LCKKLSQKSGGNMSDEAVLMKCFKYFDLNNNGTVEADEFAKAIEKIGIMIPTRQVSNLTPIPHPSAPTLCNAPLPLKV
jgi:Ca2+-binding EF-hand superfamily protein